MTIDICNTEVDPLVKLRKCYNIKKILALYLSRIFVIEMFTNIFSYLVESRCGEYNF